MTAPHPLTPGIFCAARRELRVDPASPSGLRWSLSKKGVKRAGVVAGSRRSNGYWFVGICRHRVQAGRLVLLLSGVEPDIPTQEVEHVDGDPSNNRLKNLRWSLDNADQNLNRRYDSHSGYRWVHRQSRHDSYFYQFVVPRSKPPQYVRQSGFSTPEEAYEAATAKRIALGLDIYQRGPAERPTPGV